MYELRIGLTFSAVMSDSCWGKNRVYMLVQPITLICQSPVGMIFGHVGNVLDDDSGRCLVI